MQVWNKNKMAWAARPFREGVVERFRAGVAEHHLEQIISHASYLPNLGSPKPELWEKSVAGVALELERCAELGLFGLNLHPGAHTGSGTTAGIAAIAKGIDAAFERLESPGVTLLLENTSGKGTTIGGDWSELQAIIEVSTHADRLGVTFDTCHAFAMGHDIRTAEGCEEVFAAFDDIIGLKRLMAMHLNDSKGGYQSKVDRHQHIGEGHIGLEGFRYILGRFPDIPKVLETPQRSPEDDGYAGNLATLRGLLG